MSADPSVLQAPSPRAKLDVGVLREAQLVLERYQYSFLAKKIGKMAAALELEKRDDDA